MLRLEEYQVRCRETALPARTMSELASDIEGGDLPEIIAEQLGDVLRWVAAYAERIGYTLSEIAEGGLEHDNKV